ncbi:MAG: response regulator [Chitinivibrionales bacterium]|nr:response regulator [Chitinivibrionales bacterium]
MSTAYETGTKIVLGIGNMQAYNMKHTVLIADDDQLYLKAMSTYLHRSGYVTLRVSSGGRAVRTLSSRRVDMCIIDYHLPGESLIEYLNEREDTRESIPFIIITGDLSLETERLARSYSPVFFFVKPLELSDLRSVVDTVLTKGKAHEHYHY